MEASQAIAAAFLPKATSTDQGMVAGLVESLIKCLDPEDRKLLVDRVEAAAGRRSGVMAAMVSATRDIAGHHSWDLHELIKFLGQELEEE